MIDVRVEVRPPWPFRLGRASLDGLLRRRGAALQRLVHAEGEPVLAGVVQPAPDRVVFGARASSEAAARHAIERMRFASGVDDDLRPFHDAFRDDAVIGASVRANPHLRLGRRPCPWETLAWAVTEQLIELERAVEIQRRLVAVLGHHCPDTGLRAAPRPHVVASAAPALLASFGLSPQRSLTLRRIARELAAGRIDLDAPDHEAGWRRLRAIPGVGPWTVETLALFGQGRYDHVPAGDLGFLAIVGRLSTGNPRAHADEAEVREFFAPYGAWKGLAGEHLREAVRRGGASADASRPVRTPRGPVPRREGTRSSAPGRRSAAA